MSLRAKFPLINFALIGLLLFTVSPLKGQAFIQNAYSRNKLSLNGKWQIIINWYDIKREAIGQDAKPTSKSDFVEFDFTDALTLNVPGDWNSQRPELQYYEGTISYRRSFDYHKKPDNRVFLYFGAANYLTEVYLNGQRLGIHEGGFTPFQFEITDQLKQEGNVLVVHVNNERREDNIPARNFGWWNFGGITRDVCIIETPKLFVEDYAVQLAKGTLDQIDGWIKLSGASSRQEVVVEIPEEKLRRTLRTDSNGYATFSWKANLSLWSPEHPKLYTVSISIPTETVREEIGFRSIEVSGMDILLNGKPVFLKGINIHEEISEAMRRASSEADAHQILGWAKELGCNFIRLSHYPMNEQIVRLAEKMGFMLWEEIPLWQKIQFDNPIILDKALAQLTEMIVRDRNRCNVIMWSVSNETRPGLERNDVLIKLLQKARDLDSSRLVTAAISHLKYDGNTVIVDDPVCQYMDVVGINKYLGWYEPWPSAPGDVNWIFNFDKPVIYSEFGSEALYGNHGPSDIASQWTEEHQERVYQNNIQMFKSMQPLRGTCPWLLVDFRDPTRLHPLFQEGWNRKGLLSDNGDKKKSWFIMKKYYDSITVTY